MLTVDSPTRHMSTGGEVSRVLDLPEQFTVSDGGLTFTHGPFKEDCATPRRSECKEKIVVGTIGSGTCDTFSGYY